MEEENTLEKIAKFQSLKKDLFQNIVFACPSLAKLAKARDVGLSSVHLETAQEFCCELAKNIEFLSGYVRSVESISGFVKQLKLYDDDFLEVRVHLFEKGASETYIHDHKSSFISCCLQGSYTHKLYFVDDGNQYEHYERVKGSEPKIQDQRRGAENILAHYFEAGQSLFLGEKAYHTVTPNNKTFEPVITLVIRDKKYSSKNHNNVLLDSKTQDPTIFKEQNPILIQPNGSEYEIVVNQFRKVLEKYFVTCVLKQAVIAKIDTQLELLTDIIQTFITNKEQITEEGEDRLVAFLGLLGILISQLFMKNATRWICLILKKRFSIPLPKETELEIFKKEESNVRLYAYYKWALFNVFDENITKEIIDVVEGLHKKQQQQEVRKLLPKLFNLINQLGFPKLLFRDVFSMLNE